MLLFLFSLTNRAVSTNSSEIFRWGCKHESVAMIAYEKFAKGHHTNFSVNSCGLFVSHEHPYVGASPDGLVSCTCCGDGCLEIKCPLCQDPTKIPECLNIDGTLKKEHAYFYQVQFQMGITGRLYSDFVVWKESGMLVNRIKFDASFFQYLIQSSRAFFLKCVLPELLGRWFTNHPSPGDKVIDTSSVICYCRRSANEQVVKCASAECKIGSFHLECLRLKRLQKKSWLCPDCRSLAKAKSNKSN